MIIWTGKCLFCGILAVLKKATNIVLWCSFWLLRLFLMESSKYLSLFLSSKRLLLCFSEVVPLVFFTLSPAHWHIYIYIYIYIYTILTPLFIALPPFLFHTLFTPHLIRSSTLDSFCKACEGNSASWGLPSTYSINVYLYSMRCQPFKDEAQTALFKALVRTAQ
jgi:hypothetical protein